MIINLTEAQTNSLGTMVHAVSKIEIAPIITGIKITVEGNRLTAIASDRYKIVELGFDLVDDQTVPEKQEYIIPGKNLAEIAKSLRAAKPRKGNALAVAGFNFEESALAVTYLPKNRPLGGSLYLSGNFPAVERLLDDWEPGVLGGGISLNPKLIADIAKIFPPSEVNTHKKGELPLRFLFGGVSEHNPEKPNPLKVLRPGVPEEDFRALLQPLLSPSSRR